MLDTIFNRVAYLCPELIQRRHSSDFVREFDTSGHESPLCYVPTVLEFVATVACFVNAANAGLYVSTTKLSSYIFAILFIFLSSLTFISYEAIDCELPFSRGKIYIEAPLKDS